MPDVSATILEKLARLRTHQRRVATATGAARVILIAGVTLLGAACLDVAVELPWIVRALAWASGAAGIYWGINRWVLVPRRQEVDEEQLAIAVDGDKELGPALNGAVLTIVQFGKALASGSLQGAEDTARAILREAAARASGLDFRRCVPKAVLAKMAAGCGVVLLLGAMAVQQAPGPSGVALLRLLLVLNVPYPTATRIVAVSPPDDCTLKQGDPLFLEVTAAGEVPPEGTLAVFSPQGEETRHVLPRADESRFRVRLPDLAEDYTYQVRLGDARSRVFSAHVLLQPKLTLTVEVKPPAYTGIEPSIVAGGTAAVLEGSQVRLLVASSKPLVQASLRANRAVAGLTPSRSFAAAGELPSPLLAATPWFTARHDFAYRWLVSDEEDVSGGTASESQITVQPDNPPTIALLTAADRIDMLPDGKLRLPYTVQDDWGIGLVGLESITHRLARTEGPLPAALKQREQIAAALSMVAKPGESGDGSRRERRAFGEATYDLKGRLLAPGDRVELRLWVEDLRALGPNIAESPPVSVKIVTAEQLRQSLRERMAQVVQGEIASRRDELRSLRDDTQAAAKAASRRDIRSDNLAQRQRALANSLGDLEQSGLAPIAKWMQDNGVAQEKEFRAPADTQAALADARKTLTRSADLLEQADKLANQRAERLSQSAQTQSSTLETLDRLCGQAAPQQELDQLKEQLSALREELRGVQEGTVTQARRAIAEEDPLRAIDQEDLRGLARSLDKVDRGYGELDGRLQQQAKAGPESDPSDPVRAAAEAGRRSAVAEHLEQAQDALAAARRQEAQPGQKRQDLENQRLASRLQTAASAEQQALDGMREQQTALASSPRDRQRQAEQLQERLAREQKNWSAADSPDAMARSAARLDALAQDAKPVDAETARTLEQAAEEARRREEAALDGDAAEAQHRQQQAAGQLAQAGQRLEQVAGRRQPDGRREEADQWQTLAEEAQQLARRQEDLADRTASTQPQQSQELNRQRSEQQKLADKMQKLADQAPDPKSQAAQQLQQAARSAQAAQKSLEERDPQQAKQQQASAQAQLENAAQQAGQASRSDSPREASQMQAAEQQMQDAASQQQQLAAKTQQMADGGSKASQQGQAAELAGQQQQLAEQIGQIPAGDQAGQQSLSDARRYAEAAAEALKGSPPRPQLAAGFQLQAQRALEQARARVDQAYRSVAPPAGRWRKPEVVERLGSSGEGGFPAEYRARFEDYYRYHFKSDGGPAK